MGYCQNCRRPISNFHQQADVWKCPRCGSTFTWLGPDSPEGTSLEGAIQACLREFGVVWDGLPTMLWRGDASYPQTLFSPDQTWHIYVTRSSARYRPQFEFQMRHEVFHRVCSRNVFHWAHELLAVHFTFRSVESLGLAPDYFDMEKAGWRADAWRCPLPSVLAVDGTEKYPDHLYAALFVLGEDLLRVVDWKDLKRLATFWKGALPDVEGWLRSLPGRIECEARIALTPELSPT